MTAKWHRRAVLFAVVALSAGLAMPHPLLAATGTATSTPREVVDHLHGALIGSMKGGEALGIRGRYQALETTIRESFDLPRMIRIASGSHWARADAPQRQALADAFSRLSVSTYASRFNRFSGQVFEIVGERAGPGDSRLVDTRIVSPGDEPVPITYVLDRRNDQWRIVNIILDGTISELAVRRSEYGSILRRAGPPGLTAELNAKADALLAE